MTPRPILPSNRKFGALCVFVFLTLAIHKYISEGISSTVFLYSAFVLLFSIASIFNLKVLTPFNKAWFIFGKILGSLTSPIILGFIYIFLIIPIGLIMKLLRRDVLKLRRPIKCSSYWQRPVSSTIDVESFKNQF